MTQGKVTRIIAIVIGITALCVCCAKPKVNTGQETKTEETAGLTDKAECNKTEGDKVENELSVAQVDSESAATSLSEPKVMEKYVGEFPAEARKIKSGKGWIAYVEKTGSTDCYDVCRLYLENNKTKERYLAIEGRGDKQTGTKLPIKARNKCAYGLDESGYKDTSSYEDGYIQAIDDVDFLTASKILIIGSPDCRNYYYYILDLKDCLAVHVAMYGGYSGVVEENGKTCLKGYTPDYSTGTRLSALVYYDLDGNLVRQSKQLYDMDGNPVED